MSSRAKETICGMVTAITLLIITFLTKSVQLRYLPCNITLVCQFLLVAQSIETSTTKSVFLWNRSESDVHLFGKFRMTFT